MENGNAVMYCDFFPELIKELDWLMNICTKFVAEVFEPIHMTLLMKDENGDIICGEDIKGKNLTEIVTSWQKRMRNTCSRYYPVARKLPDISSLSCPVKIECAICNETKEEKENKKLYNEMMERAKERLS